MRCITDTRYPKRMFDTVASSIWAFVCWCWQLPPGSCKTKWNGGYTSNALGWPKLGGYTLGKVVYFVGGHSGMSEFLRRPRLRWHLFVNMTKLDDRFAQASTCPSRRLSLCLRKISDSPSEMRGLVFGTVPENIVLSIISPTTHLTPPLFVFGVSSISSSPP